jgi:hypothetical protein
MRQDRVGFRGTGACLFTGFQAAVRALLRRSVTPFQWRSSMFRRLKYLPPILHESLFGLESSVSRLATMVSTIPEALKPVGIKTTILHPPGVQQT